MPEPVIDWSTFPNAYERALEGRLDRHVIVSELLADNPLGDPAERPVEVYVPPGYDEDPERRYRSVYVIQGYTGAEPMWHNRSAFRPTFPVGLDQHRAQITAEWIDITIVTRGLLKLHGLQACADELRA